MVAERLQGHLQYAMAATSLDVGNEPDATGIMLEPGVV
jgi:hypothetical protein